MWCQKCQADVAGIASPDNERALCTTCGNEIARSVQPPPAESQSVSEKSVQPQTMPLQTAPMQPVQAQSALTQAVQEKSVPVPSVSIPSVSVQTVAVPSVPPPALQPSPSEKVRVDPGTAAPAESARLLRDPRELLARWAREDALNPLEFAGSREPQSENRKPVSRLDPSHSLAAPRPAAFDESVRVNAPVSGGPSAPPAVAMPELPHIAGHDNIIHQVHAPNPPHFPTVPISMADKSSKWMTLIGQIFAYLGVAGLTVGTSLILMGYFGGPASYATTGWLVATAGQMLLFLGVVTLVSGGMEQTTQEVARRIDTLGERLVRIEQATERAEAKRVG